MGASVAGDKGMHCHHEANLGAMLSMVASLTPYLASTSSLMGFIRADVACKWFQCAAGAPMAASRRETRA